MRMTVLPYWLLWGIGVVTLLWESVMVGFFAFSGEGPKAIYWGAGMIAGLVVIPLIAGLIFAISTLLSVAVACVRGARSRG